MGDVAMETRLREKRTAAEDRHVLGSLRQQHGLALGSIRRSRFPHVLVTTRRTIRKNKYVDYVGEYHLELLVKLGCLPILVPVVEGTSDCLHAYMEEMHGLLIVEGEDISPRFYRATRENHRYLEKTHPLKDQIEIKLMREALRQGVPVLGICRGSQLLNIVGGGTLYGDVQKEKKSRRRHIDHHHYDSYRHPLTILPGTPLAAWYGHSEIRVNSYHHQGVRDLGRRFRAMAVADDGLVEAFYDPKALFTVGLQFHPERMLSEYRGNVRVWEAFAAAIRRRAIGR
ncbi:MAG TPA: type 1 glutamine amidotransferase [Elusimicrobiota bacterium]|nr:type 1 glutamine amidotransferase [Elusimicrobiota bacterium]